MDAIHFCNNQVHNAVFELKSSKKQMFYFVFVCSLGEVFTPILDFNLDSKRKLFWEQLLLLQYIHWS